MLQPESGTFDPKDDGEALNIGRRPTAFLYHSSNDMAVLRKQGHLPTSEQVRFVPW